MKPGNEVKTQELWYVAQRHPFLVSYLLSPLSSPLSLGASHPTTPLPSPPLPCSQNQVLVMIGGFWLVYPFLQGH